MNLTKEDRDCLIKYSRKPENLPLALAIGAIQDNLRIAIITEFLKGLQEYVKAGLNNKKLPWCVTQVPREKEEDDILILSIKREELKRDVGLYKWMGKEWQTYVGGKCYCGPTLTREQLEPALVGIGTGGKYDSNGFEWWRNTEQEYQSLGSDEALTTMNLENDRKEFVEHYGDVLLKAVEVTEDLL